jgi:Flp pilus assembly protein TadG
MTARPAILPCRAFTRDRRATTTLEFAVNGLVLLLFLFGIVNLGDLGLTVGTMKRAVEATVRTATVQTSAALAQSGNPAACATAAQIIADFNNIASPILPPASAVSVSGYPTIAYTWTNATAANPVPGTTLAITASFRWVPLGLSPAFGPGIPLTITATQLVIGTSGATTACA